MFLLRLEKETISKKSELELRKPALSNLYDGTTSHCDTLFENFDEALAELEKVGEILPELRIPTHRTLTLLSPVVLPRAFPSSPLFSGQPSATKAHAHLGPNDGVSTPDSNSIHAAKGFQAVHSFNASMRIVQFRKRTSEDIGEAEDRIVAKRNRSEHSSLHTHKEEDEEDEEDQEDEE
ncbi:hypothetical protein DFP72DRAFT_55452 [Ephemerocybe angulata]|uniref:Uncharacterized protein n=1 Tax=Ephemerocybe angulata TaxID=980116 RepID=A0A8H6IAV4_9AGAR|nr:hypothetical protein DFP72DRAFT_55452 [Tulosesus angulatus]